MDLSPVLQTIRDLPGYGNLHRRLGGDGKTTLSLPLSRAARPPIAASLALDLRQPILYVVPRNDRLHALLDELNAWSPEIRLLTFPEPNPLFYEQAPWNARTINQRIRCLATLVAPRQPGAPQRTDPEASTVILTSARGLMSHTISSREFIANSRWLKRGGVIRLEKLLNHLIGVGYAPSGLVTEPGQFSRRGGILDLWPPAELKPIRLELFGDEIESLRDFDPTTQRSSESIAQILITPAREGLPKLYRPIWDSRLPDGDRPIEVQVESHLETFLPWMNPTPTGLLDYLPPDATVLLDDGFALGNALDELEEQALELRDEGIGAGSISEDAPRPYLTSSEIAETLEGYWTIDLGLISNVGETAESLGEAFSPGPRLAGQLRLVMEHLVECRIAHETVVVASRQAKRLAELWSEVDEPRSVLDALPAPLFPGEIYFLRGALTEGWRLDKPDGDRLHLLTDAEIFGWRRPQPRARPRRVAATPESAYADLRPGDWVVHVDFGIGRFDGLVERTIEDLRREYLQVSYEGGDRVFVPIHQADRITRYVGADGTPPRLSRLGTQEWERTKAKAYEAAEEIAREMLDLYARRATVRGHAFSPDNPWQNALEAAFPYIETEDQLTAIEAVKRDMERPQPMDRLICGDVGYGKTEVALRAAFKAVMDGKQVGILVPTTVLAQQHYNTFRQRLAAFPVEVEMLSRFRSRSEAGEIIERLASGEIDIVIGTHRLLQGDVKFKDLGLLIIDEEQRFGVTHKEHLKRMRTEVDVLTMTATPIPRTLYMALTGVRDISTIDTPPEERLATVTHVGAYNPRTVRQAILRELDRGGQVFFVHNRVETITAIRGKLERLVPEARVAIAHGQMPERALAEVMEQFNRGEVDVLVSTSIIESGLDIPNANTLIVDRADHFGLAQLYQLRGRVGRGAVQAYAYFFQHPNVRATEEGLLRLEIIAENSDLGAGYTIAMRDLEMRGAGDILGTRQHGHIAAIGFHLYTKALAAAVRRVRKDLDTLGVSPPPLGISEPLLVSVDLPLPSAIPSDYVQDRSLRLQLYRRLAELRTEDELEGVRLELGDRFGPPPPEVENLLFQLRVKILAAAARVEVISSENSQILLRMTPESTQDDLGDLGPDIRRNKRGVWLPRATDARWRERLLDLLLKLAEAQRQPTPAPQANPPRDETSTPPSEG